MSERGYDLLAIGGAHVDRRARLLDEHKPYTSNPASLFEEVGGGAFNALRAACAFGHSGAMLSIRGGDLSGDAVASAIEAAGIADLSTIYLDRSSPSYTALLSPDGDLVTAFADMAIYEFGLGVAVRKAHVRRWIRHAGAVLVDANMMPASMARVLREATGPVTALAISASKAPRLGQLLPYFRCVFMNRYEAAALTGLHEDAPHTAMAEALRKTGLKSGIVTFGNAQTLVLNGTTTWLVDPMPATRVVDVTGAGDALAGTALAALMNGRPLIDAARLGMVYAARVVAQQGCAPSVALDNLEQDASALAVTEVTP